MLPGHGLKMVSLCEGVPQTRCALVLPVGVLTVLLQ